LILGHELKYNNNMRDINFIIGVDGGGTKTIAALANLQGKIIRKITIGPSNPNKVGN